MTPDVARCCDCDTTIDPDSDCPYCPLCEIEAEQRADDVLTYDESYADWVGDF